MKVMVNNPIALYDLKRTMPISKNKHLHYKRKDRPKQYLSSQRKEVLMSKMTERFYCKGSK